MSSIGGSQEILNHLRMWIEGSNSSRFSARSVKLGQHLDKVGFSLRTRDSGLTDILGHGRLCAQYEAWTHNIPVM